MTGDYTREIVDRATINRTIGAINQDVWPPTMYSIEDNTRLIVNTTNDYTNAAMLNSIRKMVRGIHDEISHNPF